MKIITQECEQCQARFVVNTGNRKFCSIECQKLATKQARQEKAAEARRAKNTKCGFCDQDFVGRHGKQIYCSDQCFESNRKQWYLTYQRDYQREYGRLPEVAVKRRARMLRNLYELTLEEYEALAVQQGRVCAICKSNANGRQSNLDVDHCHKTGVVRGLLCNRCNTGIGQFNDDSKLLLAASEYLTNAEDRDTE